MFASEPKLDAVGACTTFLDHLKAGSASPPRGSPPPPNAIRVFVCNDFGLKAYIIRHPFNLPLKAWTGLAPIGPERGITLWRCNYRTISAGTLRSAAEWDRSADGGPHWLLSVYR